MRKQKIINMGLSLLIAGALAACGSPSKDSGKVQSSGAVHESTEISENTAGPASDAASETTVVSETEESSIEGRKTGQETQESAEQSSDTAVSSEASDEEYVPDAGKYSEAYNADGVLISVDPAAQDTEEGLGVYFYAQNDSDKSLMMSLKGGDAVMAVSENRYIIEPQSSDYFFVPIAAGPDSEYPVAITIFYKGIMPSEKVLDFPVDCNTLTGSVNL